MVSAPPPNRFFRALLRLCPAEFREEFADQMHADFHEQRQEARGRPRELGGLWLRTTIDLLRCALREHVDALTQDVASGLRLVRRQPAWSAIAVFSLAIGIGLNAAASSVIGGILWRSLPFVESDRLVTVGEVTRTYRQPTPILAATLLEITTHTRTLAAVGGGAMQSLTIVAPGEPAETGCLAVTRGFFDVLQARPALGRVFTQSDYDVAFARRAPADGAAAAPAVVILSDKVRRSRFGDDVHVIGSQLRLAGGERVEVVGVMGPELDGLGRALPGQCWFPEVPDPAQGPWRPFLTIGRLAQGRSLRDVTTELGALGRGLPRDAFTREPQTLSAIGLLDSLVTRVRTQLLFLFAAVAMVLLLTCANVANLFLAHTAGRQDELSMRLALGASRWRLLRQSMTESLTIALLGGGVGFALAAWAVPVIVALAPADLPRLHEITVDWFTFAVTFGIATVVGIVCGLVAAWSAHARPSTVFGIPGATSAPRVTRFRRGIVVCEIALALMLAVAATLMVRTVRALNAIDLGFDPAHVVSVRLSSTEPDMRSVQALQMTIVEQVKALPAVRAAGIGGGPLEGGMFVRGVVVPGNARDFGSVRVDAVSPGYFEALGARLISGRLFTSRDAIAGGPLLTLVNESAARAFWGTSDPIGKTIMLGKPPELQVVGVVADMRGSTLEEDPGPTLYQLSHQSQNFLAGAMLIRVDGDPQALVPRIRQVIRSLRPDQPFDGVQPLQGRIDRAMAPRLFVMRLMGLFSVLALTLAIVGVYGVLAAFVTQRIPEIGVRMAFGATTSDVLTLIVGQGARLVAIGVAAGLVGALLLRGSMTSMVYGVRTFDVMAYLFAALGLAAATLAAAAVPATRASRVDPVAALRAQ
jgi:predicted permease